MIMHLVLTGGCTGWMLAFHLLWSREWSAHHYKRAALLTVAIAIAWLAAAFFAILFYLDAQGVLA